MKKIVLVGPESTGKTTLAQQLAVRFCTIWIPEYARSYVEKLNRAYTYDDVLYIAQKQIEIVEQLSHNNAVVFFDTDLIITKVWLEVVYKRCPEWINDAIRSTAADLYLLCNCDLEWKPDPVRENGGEARTQLFLLYKQQIEQFGFRFEIVSGVGEERLKNAIFFVKNYIND